MKPGSLTIVYHPAGADPALLQPESATTVHELLRAANLGSERPGLRTVGIWDLSISLGKTPALLRRMNAAQDQWFFVEVLAVAPCGMIAKPDRVRLWLLQDRVRTWLQKQLDENELNAPIEKMIDKISRSNMVVGDFFERASGIREALGVDFLVGVVPGMLAGFDDERIFANHTSDFDQDTHRTILVSVYGFPEFAANVEHPYEALVQWAILGQLLVSAYSAYDGLAYHLDHRGCLFDYNRTRSKITDGFAAGNIDEECLSRIPEDGRAPVLQLVKVLSEYRTTGNEQNEN